MCDKIKYKSKSYALLEGLHLVSTGKWKKSNLYRAYYCGKCRAWHLTSRKDYYN